MKKQLKNSSKRFPALLIWDIKPWSCAAVFVRSNTDDYDRYANVDRGFVIDIEKSPFLTARTMPDLMKLISEITPETAAQNDRDILAFYQSTQTDHSADDVVSVILAHMEHFSEES